MNPFEFLTPQRYSELAKAGGVAAFVADVVKSWRLVDQMCAEHLQQGQPPVGIGWDIGCALIHSSISSVASQLSPALLAESVRRGIWPHEQALFLSRCTVDPVKRVRALAELLSVTPSSEHASMVQEIVTGIGTAESAALIFGVHLYDIAMKLVDAGFTNEAIEVCRKLQDTRSLIAVACRVAEPMRTRLMLEALDAVRDEKTASLRAAYFVRLVPYLSEPFRTNAIADGLAAARTVERQRIERRRDDDGFAAVGRVYDLARFLPHLSALDSEHLVSEILEKIRNIEKDVHRSRAVADSLNYLPEFLKRPLLDDALKTARSISDAKDRAWQLGWLLPHLAEPSRTVVLEEALESTRQIRSGHEYAHALAHLIPYFSESMAGQFAIELSGKHQDWSLGWAVSEIALRLSEFGRQKEAVDLARTIENQDYRRGTLGKLAPVLPAPTLEEALSPSDIGDDAERRRACIGLAAYLREEYQVEALRSVRLLPDWVPSGYCKTHALEDLVQTLAPSLLTETVNHVSQWPEQVWGHSPRLSGLATLTSRLHSAGLRKESIALAVSFKNRALRVEALAYVLPFLSQPEREIAFQEAMDSLALIKRQPHYVNAIVHLAAQCEESIRMILVQEGMDAAARIPGQYDRAQALAALGPLLPPQLLEKAMSMAEEIEDGNVTAVVGLAPHFPEPERTILLRQALSHAVHAPMCIGLNEIMAVITGTLVPEAKSVLMRVRQPWIRIEARTALALRLTELGNFKSAFGFVSDLKRSPNEQATIIERLATQIPAERLHQILKISSAMTTYYETPGRCRIVAAIAPRLAMEERAVVLKDIVEVICRRNEEDDRRKMWTKVAPALLTLDPVLLHPIWCGAWRALARRTRPQLFADVYALRSVLAKLGGSEGVAKTYNAIARAVHVFP